MIVTALAILLAAPVTVSAAAHSEAPGASRAKSGLTASEGRGDAYARLMEAYLAAVNGEADRAVQLLLRGAEIRKGDAGYLGQAADLLLRMHRTENADRTARRALALDPDESVALRVLAEITSRRYAADPSNDQLRAEAIRLLERLAAQDRKRPIFHSGVHRMLAELKASGGDLEGAVEEARKQVNRSPSDLGNRRYLASLLLRAGRPGDAFDEVRRFLEENPRAVPLLPTLAMAAGESGRWEDAAALLGKMAKDDPDSPDVARLFGEALLRVGRAAEAVPELQKAIAAGPAPETRFQLALAYAETGRLADATSTARHLVADHPGEPAFQSLLADSLATQGLVDEALAAFRKALDLLAARDNPGAPAQRDQNRLRIAGLLLRTGRAREAEEVLAGVERKDTPDVLEMAGRVALKLEDAGGVRRIESRLRQAGEEGTAAWLGGALAVHEGKIGRAIEQFSQAARLIGNGVLVRAAELLRTTGHAEAGRRLLEASLHEHPNDGELHYYLGAYLDEEGHRAEAERRLREAIRLDSRNSHALNHLGYSLAERNERLDEALELVRRALEIEPWEAAYLDSLGWTYFRMGRYRDARPPLESAARDLPRDPVVQEHLGDVYRALGYTDRAVAAWKAAIKAGADDSAAIRAKIRAADHRPARMSDLPPGERGGDPLHGRR